MSLGVPESQEYLEGRPVDHASMYLTLGTRFGPMYLEL